MEEVVDWNYTYQCEFMVFNICGYSLCVGGCMKYIFWLFPPRGPRIWDIGVAVIILMLISWFLKSLLH